MLQRTPPGPNPFGDDEPPRWAGLLAAMIVIIMVVCTAWLLLAPGDGY